MPHRNHGARVALPVTASGAGAILPFITAFLRHLFEVLPPLLALTRRIDTESWFVGSGVASGAV
jgi:hypothetical protein